MGYVADVFNEARLSRLPGPHGHRPRALLDRRGPRSSSTPSRSFSRPGAGPLALAHNGNLVNAREIRGELERAGALFTTTSDSEVILHLIARSKAPTLGGGDRRGPAPRCAGPTRS